MSATRPGGRPNPACTALRPDAHCVACQKPVRYLDRFDAGVFRRICG